MDKCSIPWKNQNKKILWKIRNQRDIFAGILLYWCKISHQRVSWAQFQQSLLSYKEHFLVFSWNGCFSCFRGNVGLQDQRSLASLEENKAQICPGHCRTSVCHSEVGFLCWGSRMIHGRITCANLPFPDHLAGRRKLFSGTRVGR